MSVYKHVMGSLGSTPSHKLYLIQMKNIMPKTLQLTVLPCVLSRLLSYPPLTSALFAALQPTGADTGDVCGGPRDRDCTRSCHSGRFGRTQVRRLSR